MKNDNKNDLGPVVIGPEGGTRLEAGPNSITLKVASEHSSRMTLLEYAVGPRFAAPPVLHHHTREDWLAYVVEGELVFTVADGEVRAPTGTTLFFPAGVDFAWRNDRDAPARYLAVHAPAGFDQFFVDVAAAVAGRSDESPPEVMAEVIPPLWRKYGIEPQNTVGDSVET